MKPPSQIDDITVRLRKWLAVAISDDTLGGQTFVLSFCYGVRTVGLEANLIYSAGGAIEAFRHRYVDLRSDRTALARTSRDYLILQLNRQANINESFPPIVRRYQYFGSFARRTKTRPLDDIDIMMVLHAGQTAELYSQGDTFNLVPLSPSAPLVQFLDAAGVISSEKILNRVRNSLGTVANYHAAERKRDGQAAVLNLRSYDWSFDIVPAVEVGDGSGRTVHYLIPAGLTQGGLRPFENLGFEARQSNLL